MLSTGFQNEGYLQIPFPGACILINHKGCMRYPTRMQGKNNANASPRMVISQPDRTSRPPPICFAREEKGFVLFGRGKETGECRGGEVGKGQGIERGKTEEAVRSFDSCSAQP
jgi:hypothetical protein